MTYFIKSLSSLSTDLFFEWSRKGSTFWVIPARSQLTITINCSAEFLILASSSCVCNNFARTFQFVHFELFRTKSTWSDRKITKKNKRGWMPNLLLVSSALGNCHCQLCSLHIRNRISNSEAEVRNNRYHRISRTFVFWCCCTDFLNGWILKIVWHLTWRDFWHLNFWGKCWFCGYIISKSKAKT